MSGPLDDLTLGDAARWLAYVRGDEAVGCACMDGPRCCVLVSRHAETLERAAHIAVKQLADLAERKAEEAYGDWTDPEEPA